MRTSPVLFALVAAAVGAVHGCSLPLEGLSVTANSGGAGGAASTTSAGGALSTTTATTAAASTSTGTTCTQDSECTGGPECKIPKCMSGTCVFEVQAPDSTVCGAASGPCFDESLCVDGTCEPRPKPTGTMLGDPKGNCTDLVCDGSGNSMAIANDKDLPVDPNGSDCIAPTCNGTTTGTKVLDDGTNCGNHEHCLAGQCKQCASNSDCGIDFNICTAAVCDAGTCKQSPANDGLWCGIGQSCSHGKCCYKPGC